MLVNFIYSKMNKIIIKVKDSKNLEVFHEFLKTK
jgi:hypothetical protein